ncbi:MAG: class I SAM-dependent methyltransferase [Chloroflexota bacterium]
MLEKELVKKLKGVQETLLATLYAKGRDNRSANPVLNDHLADEAVARLEKIRPIWSLSSDAAMVASRALYLDSWTRDFLIRHPNAVVLNLACGLDTRVYRINPPDSVTWYDFDFPEVIALRRELYPDREGASYRMLDGSVTAAGWLDDAVASANRPVMLVAEGLFMYLTEHEVKTIIQQVIERFPTQGEICFDALNRLGKVAGYFHPAIFASGAIFKWGFDDPHELETWHPTLKLLDELSFGELPEREKFTLGARIGWRFLRLSKTLSHIDRLLHYKYKN